MKSTETNVQSSVKSSVGQDFNLSDTTRFNIIHILIDDREYKLQYKGSALRASQIVCDLSFSSSWGNLPGP